MAPKIFVNVNTNADQLDEVAKQVAEKTRTEGSVSVINSNSTPKNEGVIIAFFESEGTEPMTIETPFRIER